MTLTGLLYDRTLPDDAVLTIDGPDYYAGGWAKGLDGQPAVHRPGCLLAPEGVPAPVCACQPPLYTP